MHQSCRWLLAGFLACSVVWLQLAGLAQSPAPRDQRAQRGVPRRSMELLRLINAARANHQNRTETGGRAAPLRWDPAVARVALQHAEEMARDHRLRHTDAQGRSPAARMSAAGIAWSMVAENVAMAPSLAAVQQMMMSEPPFQTNHRGNILNRRLTRIGIGVVKSGDEFWVTEDFLRPPPLSGQGERNLRPPHRTNNQP